MRERVPTDVRPEGNKKEVEFVRMKLPLNKANKRSSTTMAKIAHIKWYLPHEISTKVQSVQLYRQTKDIGFVCRRHHISKASSLALE